MKGGIHHGEGLVTSDEVAVEEGPEFWTNQRVSGVDVIADQSVAFACIVQQIHVLSCAAALLLTILHRAHVMGLSGASNGRCFFNGGVGDCEGTAAVADGGALTWGAIPLARPRHSIHYFSLAAAVNASAYALLACC